MKNLIGVNTQIAGIKKNGLTIGGFKLIHISNVVYSVEWEKDNDGTAKAKRDEEGKIVKKETSGFTLSFAYKTQSKTWNGQLVDVDGEMLPTKSCLKIEINLPKNLNTQSKLYKFLVLLGEVNPVESSVISEDDLFADEDLGDLSEDDLFEDGETLEESNLNLEEIHSILLNYLNRVFIAPFILQDNGYPKLSTDFQHWKLK